jgi:hypothetical protein
MTMRVADMSVDELRTLVQETVTQALIELLRDPDEGLELRDDFEKALQHSLENVRSGGKTLSAESVAAKLDLSW